LSLRGDKLSAARQDQINYYGYKSINDMLSNECTPLIDAMLKLSSIASNFASAANNVKNVTVNESHQIKELLNVTFEARKLAEKIGKIAEERVEFNLEIIKSGVFEQILKEGLKEEAIIEAIEIGNAFKAGIKGNEGGV
jgi:hypothetical protein